MVQLSNKGPTFTLGVVCEESDEQLLCYVLLGVCKIPPRSWKSKSSLRSPQNYQPVLEECVLRVNGEEGRVGILQLQWRHPLLSWEFLKDVVCCVALSLSQTLLLFRCPSPALSFLSSYLTPFPSYFLPFDFSPSLFLIFFLTLHHCFSSFSFLLANYIFRVDHVRDGLRCGICWKMNCSQLDSTQRQQFLPTWGSGCVIRVQGCRRDICKSHSVITSFK